MNSQPKQSQIQREPFISQFAKEIGRFLNPRFSTSDFEGAHTICRKANHSIVDIEFEKKNYPKLVKGIVDYSDCITNVSIVVQWDEHGKCRSLIGNRLRHYDLVRETEKDIHSSLMFAEGMALTVIIILVCLSLN